MLNKILAKSKEGKNYTLVDHTLETLREAEELKEFLKNNCFLNIFEPNFFKNLYTALILHDLGKINKKFQYRVNKKNIDEDIKNFFSEDNSDIKDHEILSYIWSLILLNNSKDSQKIRTAILLHHYNQFYLNEQYTEYVIEEYEEDILNYLNFIKKNENVKNYLNDFLDKIKDNFKNDKEIIEILDDFKNKVDNLEKIIEKLIDKINDKDDISLYYTTYVINNENPDLKFLLFLGCLRRCDYSASGDVEIEKKVQLKKEIKNIENNIINKIGKSNLWQKELMEKIKEQQDIKQKNIVLVAPTGSGKTEFALLYAKKFNKKIVYTLPLRVALNDLYERFKEYSSEDNVSILHSTSFIEYLKENNISIETKLTSSKLLSFPFMLTTPDQVFLTSLKYYGSDKVISIYPYTLFVLDEIQAYNPEMAAIIINTLNLIKELGGNILILTATFPPYFKDFLKDFKIIECKEYIDKSKIKNYNLKRHKIKILDVKTEKNNLIKNYWKEIKKIISNNKKNCFIVLNTVKNAVELYKKAKKEIKDKDVFLLHSRLLEKRKEEIIEKIKKGLEANNKNFIVISTQIIEASVDLDFDLMITEISPIESQIQRWGRVYRKNRELKENDDPNIYILVPDKLDKGTKLIYDEQIVNKTAEVLEEYENVLLNYDKEKEMINKVYDNEIKKKYVEEIKKILDFLKYFNALKKSEAQKIFRRLAGKLILIPEFIDFEKKEEIIEMIKKGKSISEISKELNIDKWALLSELYMCSVNIPFYNFKKERQYLLKDFGVFYIINKEIAKEKLDEIKELGIYGNIFDDIIIEDTDFENNII